jgi:hypothetical protein
MGMILLGAVCTATGHKNVFSVLYVKSTLTFIKLKAYLTGEF